MQAYGLRGEPFSTKAITSKRDYNKDIIVKTRTIRVLTQEFVFGFAPMDPIHIMLLGERGCGKTTNIFYLKDFVDTNKKSDSIFTKFTNVPEISKREIDQFILKDLKGESSNHRYLFYDYPDDYKDKQLENTIATIGSLLPQRNLHIFMALSKTTYNHALRISDTFGKLEPVQIPRFTLPETIELIEKRLKYYRDPNFKAESNIYPFDKESIEIIYLKGGAVPRNMLTIAGILIRSSIEDQINNINEKYATTILEAHNYRESILRDRIEDSTIVKMLDILLNEINTEFNGIIHRETELINHMKKKYGWSNKTTRKRLQKLVNIRLLDLRRSERDLWTKEYRLL
jgi:hypothetical protein